MSQIPQLPRQNGQRHLTLDEVPIAQSFVQPRLPNGTFVKCDSQNLDNVNGIVVGSFWTTNCFTYVISCYKLRNDCACIRGDKNLRVINDINTKQKIIKRTLLGKSSPVHTTWKNLYPETYSKLTSLINQCRWSFFSMH